MGGIGGGTVLWLVCISMSSEPDMGVCRVVIEHRAWTSTVIRYSQQEKQA